MNGALHLSKNIPPPQHRENTEPPVTSHVLLSPHQWQSFDEITLQKISPRYYKQVLFKSVLIGLIAMIAVLITTILPGDLGAIQIILIVMALLLFMIALGYLWQQQALALAYGVCEHEFLMEKGLWWHKRISLPYSRIQHVSLAQGPFDRPFNLFTLKCFSAGSGSAEVELPGIEPHTAEHLRQHILAQTAKVKNSQLSTELSDSGNTPSIITKLTKQEETNTASACKAPHE